MKQKQRRLIIWAGIILLAGLCLLTSFTALGSGLGLWLILKGEGEHLTPPPRPTRRVAAAPTFTPTASPTLILTATPTATFTPTPAPTATLSPSPTPVPPTPTPVPPTDTPVPTQALPTPTPLPTDTPAPSYPFVIAETAGFPTNHENFDVYVAITDANNKPLSGYRVLGAHSSGLQIESQVSAGDWTVNSGAMHYKGGNIKYEAFNSPTGMWTLQLVDETNQPVAPPVEFSFEVGSPTWYFLLYRLEQ